MDQRIRALTRLADLGYPEARARLANEYRRAVGIESLGREYVSRDVPWRRLKEVRDELLSSGRMTAARFYFSLEQSFCDYQGPDPTEPCRECQRDIRAWEACVYYLIGGETYHVNCFWRGLTFQAAEVAYW